MKMLVVFVILLHVSQHALAVVVEVNKGAESVLLPCQYSGIIPEYDPTVMWTRSELDLKTVHLQREEGDDLRGQNERYSGRTSMRPDALDSGDFSLTLRKPQLTDSSSYTCTLSYGSAGVQRSLTHIKLQVKDLQVEVEVEEGSESVILPCQTEPDLPEDTRVEWTRSDRELVMVHVYPKRNNTQDDRYCGRTKMNEEPLRTGDLSVTLKHPTERDTGGFICTIYRDEDILRQKVVLHIKEPFPSWATVVIVLLVLLVVSGGLLFHFRHYFMSGYKVEVEQGVESVQLPCKTIVNLPQDAKVEWKDIKDRKVHVYQKGSDQPEDQDHFYKGRTNMKRSLLRTGDLSLTLKQLTDADKGTYTCTVYKNKGRILMKKQVLLQIKFPQVEVDSGVESVQLPCKATDHLTGVEWTDSLSRKVHVYKNGSDQPEEQDQVYRGRTKMNKDPLKTGDLSLTLINPTDGDTGTYTCNMFNKEGKNLKKTVELNVRVPQIQKHSEVESVQLSCRATDRLPEDVTVIWKDTYNRKVHVYQNGSDLPKEQNQVYRDRTKMNKDLPTTGDLSLTLEHPTDGDTDTYTCTVYSREGNILLRKQVELSIPVCQVEVEEGVVSVQLPFKTTQNLPGDATAKWERQEPEPPMKVHVYQSGSDQPAEQHQVYSGRTKMNKDLLKTGDLSLTLRDPTERDSGRYSCVVYSSNIWRNKTVRLKVKGTVQVQAQTEEIRNRSSSTEMTPLVEV